MLKNDLDLIIVGQYLPNIGGISIHLKRLLPLLVKFNYKLLVPSKLFSIGSNVSTNIHFNNLIIIKKKIIKLKPKILHLHSIFILERILLINAGLKSGSKIILTIHGDSLFNQYNFLKKINYNFAQKYLNLLKKCSHIIVVNKKYLNFLNENGFNKSKISHIPSYIKPNLNDLDKELSKFSKDQLSFLSNIFVDKCILANGYIKPLSKFSDVYGISFLIFFFYELKKKNLFSNFKLVFCLLGYNKMTKSELKYYSYLKQMILKYNLENDFIFLKVKNTELWPLMIKSRYFIRSNLSDGWGNSINEAIDLKIPAFASDVCSRPLQSIIFKSNDVDHLIKLITDYEFNYNKNTITISESRVYSNELLKLYAN